MVAMPALPAIAVALALAMPSPVPGPFSSAQRISAPAIGEAVAIEQGTPGDCDSYHGLAMEAGFSEAQWPTLRRILRRESHCDPGVRSRTRDTGLAQINDIVTRDVRVAGIVGFRFTVADLYDPHTNLLVAHALCVYGQRYRRNGCWWAWS